MEVRHTIHNRHGELTIFHDLRRREPVAVMGQANDGLAAGQATAGQLVILASLLTQ